MTSKTTKIFFIVVIILNLASFIWLYQSGFPPVFEQIRLSSNPFVIFVSRLVSIIIFFLILRRFLTQFKIEEKTAFFSFILLSPVYFVILTMYPLEAIKLCFVIYITSFFSNQSKFTRIGSVFIISLVVLFISLYLQHQTPQILNLLSSKTAQETVNERFRQEIVLSPNNYLPHQLKRLGYNKYFFLLKPIAEEVLSAGDLESLFFQEVHPLDQKSTPIFFWPQTILFALALYFLISKKNSKISNFYYLLSIGTIYYLFSAGSPGIRLAFIGFSVIYLLTLATPDFSHKPFNFIFLICVFLSLWGGLAHITDRWVRPDYWLDNKPLIYKYGFTNSILEGNDLPVYFSDHFGVSSYYCRYYRHDCSRFQFPNSIQDIFGRTSGIFIGFTGDYFGTDYHNFEKGSPDLTAFLKGKGVDIFHTQRIRDNILNQFGLELIIAKINSHEN